LTETFQQTHERNYLNRKKKKEDNLKDMGVLMNWILFIVFIFGTFASDKNPTAVNMDGIWKCSSVYYSPLIITGESGQYGKYGTLKDIKVIDKKCTAKWMRSDLKESENQGTVEFIFDINSFEGKWTDGENTCNCSGVRDEKSPQFKDPITLNDLQGKWINSRNLSIDVNLSSVMINDGQYDIVETEDTFIVNTWVLDKNSKNLIFTRNEDKVTWFRPEGYYENELKPEEVTLTEGYYEDAVELEEVTFEDTSHVLFNDNWEWSQMDTDEKFEKLRQENEKLQEKVHILRHANKKSIVKQNKTHILTRTSKKNIDKLNLPLNKMEKKQEKLEGKSQILNKHLHHCGENIVVLRQENNTLKDQLETNRLAHEDLEKQVDENRLANEKSIFELNLQLKTMKNELNFQFNKMKIKQDKFEGNSKKSQNELKELQYKAIYFICDDPCLQKDNCPCSISPTNAEEEAEAKRRITEFLPEDLKLKCAKVLPKTIKLTLSGDSKEELKYGIDTIRNEGFEIDGDRKTLLSIEEFGGIFSVGAIMTYYGTCPSNTGEQLELCEEITANLPMGMNCNKVEIGNDKVLYYLDANTKELLDTGMEKMPADKKKKYKIFTTEKSIIGHEVIPREHSDGCVRMQFICPSQTVKTHGIAKSWEFYSTSEESELFLQIWRPTKNPDYPFQYELISSIKYEVDAHGKHKVPFDDPLSVQDGDTIGWFHTSPVIQYDNKADDSFVYGKNKFSEIGDILSWPITEVINDEEHETPKWDRTYSIHLNVNAKDEKNTHPMEKYAKYGNGLRSYMLYIFPFGFYCRLPMFAIPLIPLAIEVTWLKAVLVNIYTIIRISCNLDDHPFKYDFRFMYMVLISAFVYVAQDYEEKLMQGIGDLGENGEYIISLWLEQFVSLEQLISGSVVLTQYFLDYKKIFQEYTISDGEVRKLNVIMAILQVISAGMFISNDYAWFVCSFLPFIFLTRLPVNPVSILAHFGAIAAASIFFKGELEMPQNFLTLFRSPAVLINALTLILFGAMSKMKQKQQEWFLTKIETFWIKNSTLKILKFISIILQLWEPYFDIKLWFTTHYILLTTPNLISKNIQKFLTGFLIILQGTSIFTSSGLPLSETLMNQEFYIGNGISLATIGLQYAISRRINEEIRTSERRTPYMMENVPQIPTSKKVKRYNKINQMVSLFVSATIPNPLLMVLSMIVPTFTCMGQWSSNILSGPIFVPLLYASIQIWDYVFRNALYDYKWNVTAVCVSILVSINSLSPTDFYFKKVVKPIKRYFSKNSKILFLYTFVTWMVFAVLINHY